MFSRAAHRHFCRSRVNRLVRAGAAIEVQRVWRGHIDRRKAKNLRWLVWLSRMIARCWRRYQARSSLIRLQALVDSQAALEVRFTLKTFPRRSHGGESRLLLVIAHQRRQPSVMHSHTHTHTCTRCFTASARAFFGSCRAGFEDARVVVAWTICFNGGGAMQRPVVWGTQRVSRSQSVWQSSTLLPQ
jgi:hypothetical protein